MHGPAADLRALLSQGRRGGAYVVRAFRYMKKSHAIPDHFASAGRRCLNAYEALKGPHYRPSNALESLIRPSRPKALEGPVRPSRAFCWR